MISRSNQQLLCLLIIARHTLTIHITESQVVFRLRILFAGRTLKPHHGRGVILLDALAIIQGIAKIELSLCFIELCSLEIIAHGNIISACLVMGISLAEPFLSLIVSYCVERQQQTYNQCYESSHLLHSTYLFEFKFPPTVAHVR